jgi:hypothetical protein
MDRIEHDASKNSSLQRERLYRVLTQQKEFTDTQRAWCSPKPFIFSSKESGLKIKTTKMKRNNINNNKPSR